ncbi:cytoplasmic dynein light chain [Teratosphaeria destructans]|uniref:Cytoplasmic dynein light chain n=1 Tax=Teratosphaeria destructans TaxID=418781 RepID=A0A9W7SL13_9PEZI|nr:cytoplasmic dynein light chain [Teratosphaeria destructans]
MATNAPVPTTTLTTLANSACDAALSTATNYEHAQTQTWNSSIINNLLKSLISETSEHEQKYKFIINSTIVQHNETKEAGSARRGMHAASGAYWNNDKDGMWSHKYAAAEQKGMDVVISVVWVAV